MTEDFRDELHELREQNDREIQALEAATPQAIEREGSDELNVVTVRIGPNGAPRSRTTLSGRTFSRRWCALRPASWTCS